MYKTKNMKKLFIILTVFFFSVVIFAQKAEMSDYEKYRLEKEAKEYPPNEKVWMTVEEMPTFNGEVSKEFRKWISLNVEYPLQSIENDIQGKVIVSFVVNSYGNVVNAKIEKSIDRYLDAEAIRVVESSPKWSPGKQDGKPVSVQFTFPISFVLDAEAPQEQSNVINNYYIDVQPDYRRSLCFGYNPYFYGYSDPFYYRPYYFGYNGYWGYGRYYNRYYGGYYGGYHGNHHPYYDHRTKDLSWTRHRYASYKKVDQNGYINPPIETRISDPKIRVTTRSSQNKNSYSPRHTRSMKSVRPEYNATTTRARPTANRPQSRNVQQSSRTQRTTYARPSTPSRSSSSYNRSSSSSRNYSTPSRSSSSYSRPSSSNRSYYVPSRSSSSYNRSSSSPNRSSGSSGGRRK